MKEQGGICWEGASSGYKIQKDLSLTRRRSPIGYASALGGSLSVPFKPEKIDHPRPRTSPNFLIFLSLSLKISKENLII